MHLSWVFSWIVPRNSSSEACIISSFKIPSMLPKYCNCSVLIYEVKCPSLLNIKFLDVVKFWVLIFAKCLPSCESSWQGYKKTWSWNKGNKQIYVLAGSQISMHLKCAQYIWTKWLLTIEMYHIHTCERRIIHVIIVKWKPQISMFWKIL